MRPGPAGLIHKVRWQQCHHHRSKHIVKQHVSSITNTFWCRVSTPAGCIAHQYICWQVAWRLKSVQLLSPYYRERSCFQVPCWQSYRWSLPVHNHSVKVSQVASPINWDGSHIIILSHMFWGCMSGTGVTESIISQVDTMDRLSRESFLEQLWRKHFAWDTAVRGVQMTYKSDLLISNHAIFCCFTVNLL